jgi:hypothetical protein
MEILDPKTMMHIPESMVNTRLNAQDLVRVADNIVILIVEILFSIQTHPQSIAQGFKHNIPALIYITMISHSLIIGNPIEFSLSNRIPALIYITMISHSPIIGNPMEFLMPRVG